MNGIVLPDAAIRDAYRYCLEIAQRHYENFPVASYALPRDLRGPVAAIYAFARTADDFADEGELDAPARLSLLEDWGDKLNALAEDAPPDDPVFVALDDVRRRFGLPLEPLRDLLHAFTIDVTRKRYEDFDGLMDYCRYSAQPIGRLLLHLYRQDDAGNLACSDAICSALQLVNFLQDIAQDYAEHGRIYLPVDEMLRCGVTEAHIAAQRTDDAMLALIALQTARILRLLAEGAPLAWRLPGRIGLELRMVLFGAQAIIDAIARERHDVFCRPRLGNRERMRIAWRAATARHF